MGSMSDCRSRSREFEPNPAHTFVEIGHEIISTVNLANSEDTDDMPHYAAFHQGLHCLLRQNRSSEKEIKYILKI